MHRGLLESLESLQRVVIPPCSGSSGFRRKFHRLSCSSYPYHGVCRPLSVRARWTCTFPATAGAAGPARPAGHRVVRRREVDEEQVGGTSTAGLAPTTADLQQSGHLSHRLLERAEAGLPAAEQVASRRSTSIASRRATADWMPTPRYAPGSVASPPFLATGPGRSRTVCQLARAVANSSCVTFEHSITRAEQCATERVCLRVLAGVRQLQDLHRHVIGTGGLVGFQRAKRVKQFLHVFLVFFAVQSPAGEETGTMTAYTEQPP
jgi:hypothetical protein